MIFWGLGIGLCVLLCAREYRAYRFGRVRAWSQRFSRAIYGFFTRVEQARQEQTLRHELEQTGGEPAKAALRKVIDARLCPPDTVSAGVMYGGPALFFKHNQATEVFIGRDYNHAADKLIEWLRGPLRDLPTSKTTKLNRKQRRAWASNKRENLQ